MKQFFSFLVIVLSVANSFGQHDPDYCYATDPERPQKSRLVERTSYDIIRGSLNLPNTTCVPSKFWFYTRGGARLPAAIDIERMQNLTPAVQNIVSARTSGRGNLCEPDFNLIRDWQLDPNITVESEQFLTVAGWNQMKNIAIRYQRAFSTLLPNTYNRSQITFRHTDRQRTRANVFAFADGLYDGDFEQVMPEPPQNPDRLLRPHDGCDFYNEATNNRIQRFAFENGDLFQTMMEQVNDKLGLVGAQRLDVRQVRIIWEVCAYEQLWNLETPAPFCGAFSMDNNLVLEYFEDLDFYYNTGYGGPRRLFENMNCPLIQDMFDFLENDNGVETARVYTSHSTAFRLMLVSLGVFGADETLNSDNFHQQACREYRSSLISPMATNLAVIRYDCDGTDDSDVLFMMNESPLVIPGCQTNGICKMSFIRARYQRLLRANCAHIQCSHR